MYGSWLLQAPQNFGVDEATSATPSTTRSTVRTIAAIVTPRVVS
jgi:hypothetical protein